VRRTDAPGLKRWCYLNIIAPGLLALDGNNSTYEGPTCHAPPAPNPLQADYYTGTPLGFIILLTVVIVATLGVLLLLRRRRRRRALERQLRSGAITPEERDRMG
jgi:hypothetical protein